MACMKISIVGWRRGRLVRGWDGKDKVRVGYAGRFMLLAGFGTVEVGRTDLLL